MSDYAEIETLHARLDARRAILLQALQPLGREAWLQPGPGGWSVKDILAHLAYAEAVNVKFARLMLSQDRPEQLVVLAQDYPDYVGPFTLDNFNAYMTAKWRAKSLEEIEAALLETRAETLAWLDSLTPEQLERGGQHAVWGDQTIRGIFKILAIHDKLHTQDIQDLTR